jgi:3-isopropylmalate dehydrogenase
VIDTDATSGRRPDEPLDLVFMAGDGIGPEITIAVRTALTAVLRHHAIDWVGTDADIGFTALEQAGTTLPEASSAAARRADGVILGPVSHADYPPVQAGGVNPSGQLRKRLDLFANIRPARTVSGVPHASRHEFDLVIVRENTEGFYADRTMHDGTGEFMPTPDLAMALRKVTRAGSLRIARKGFELARQRRSHLTVVHKANVLRMSDGLFLDCTREVAAEFPDIEYHEELVDAMAAHLVRAPERFDVIVTTNMFGDILSDEATELAGGLGMAASINVGAHHCVAQAQHGSAPGLAGLGVANPCSLIESSAMLLRWLGEKRRDPRLVSAAGTLDEAVLRALDSASTRTRDLGGTASTVDFTAAVVAGLA